MGLEEHTLEEIKKNCERCGTELTEKEIAATIDIGEGPFLCAICSNEDLSEPDDEGSFE